LGLGFARGVTPPPRRTARAPLPLLLQKGNTPLYTAGFIRALSKGPDGYWGRAPPKGGGRKIPRRHRIPLLCVPSRTLPSSSW